MALNPQTGLQQFGFFKKIAKKLLKPPGGSKFIKQTLMPPGLKKSLEYSLLPHRALGMSERDLLMPHRALRKGMRGRDRGIGGLPRKLLEGRQFPRGIPEQFRQLPFGPPTMQPMVPWSPPAPPPEFGHMGHDLLNRGSPTISPEELRASIGRTSPSPMQPIPRLPEDMKDMVYPGGTPGFYDDGRNIGNFDEDLFNQMPMPSLTPEEITQQRIDQVSQFEQEPMMGARYGDIGGYAGGGIAELLHYYGV